MNNSLKEFRRELDINKKAYSKKIKSLSKKFLNNLKKAKKRLKASQKNLIHLNYLKSLKRRNKTRRISNF
jgi:hypothetical protein